MTLPNAKPRDTHFEGRLMHDPACRAWLSEFIDHWLQASSPAKSAKGKSANGKAAKIAKPMIAAPKPARANGGGGQRRAISRVSTR
jgi:hypothetical protein